MSNTLKPSPDYWRRTLRALAEPGEAVLLAFMDSEGRERWVQVELASLDDPRGPLVVWGGERRRLCAWESLTAVEAAR